MENVLMVILFICPLMIQSYDVYFCATKSDGNFADPGNCYDYYQCSNQVTFHYTCNAGLIWRQHLDRCEYGDCSIATTMPTVFDSSMEVVSYELKKNRYIKDYVLDKGTSHSIIDCARKCLQLKHSTCKGYNYYESDHICELLEDVVSAPLTLPNVILAKRLAKPP